MTEKSTDDDNYFVNDNYHSNDGNFDDNDKKIPHKKHKNIMTFEQKYINF